MTRHGFVICTKTNREMSACMHYERQGHEVHLPPIRQRMVRRHTRRNRVVLRPFSPE